MVPPLATARPASLLWVVKALGAPPLAINIRIQAVLLPQVELLLWNHTRALPLEIALLVSLLWVTLVAAGRVQLAINIHIQDALLVQPVLLQWSRDMALPLEIAQ
jgi:hypothetical protein